MSAFQTLVDELAAVEFVQGPVLAKSLHCTDEAMAEAALVRWGRTPKAAIRKALNEFQVFKSTGLRRPTLADIESIAANSRAGRAAWRSLKGELASLAKAMPKPTRSTTSPAITRARLAGLFAQARTETQIELANGRISPDQAHRADFILRQAASQRGLPC